LCTEGSGGPYYGITASGDCDSITIENNEVSNYYFYGIRLSGGKGVKILNNEVHRSTKTSTTTFYGIYTTGTMDGAVIMNNRVHSPYGGTGSATGSAYAMYLLGDGTATDPILIANNLIYNMNQGGIARGFYVSTATHNKIYHNTVV